MQKASASWQWPEMEKTEAVLFRNRRRATRHVEEILGKIEARNHMERS